MTSEEKAEIAAAMRRIAKDTFEAGFIIGRQLLTDQIHEPVLDEAMEKKSAALMFNLYERKLQKIYGERN